MPASRIAWANSGSRRGSRSPGGWRRSRSRGRCAGCPRYPDRPGSAACPPHQVGFVGLERCRAKRSSLSRSPPYGYPVRWRRAARDGDFGALATRSLPIFIVVEAADEFVTIQWTPRAGDYRRPRQGAQASAAAALRLRTARPGRIAVSPPRSACAALPPQRAKRTDPTRRSVAGDDQRLHGCGRTSLHGLEKLDAVHAAGQPEVGDVEVGAGGCSVGERVIGAE